MPPKKQTGKVGNTNATKKNRFDLDKKSTGKKKKGPVTYSTKQKMDLLEGYRKYEDPRKWVKLPAGAHVRIIKVDGKFLRGGFIRSVFKNQSDGEYRMSLENKKYNRQAPGYVTFSVPLKDIQRLFVKTTSLEQALKEQPSQPVQTDKESEKKFDIMVRALKNYSRHIEKLNNTVEEQQDEINSLKKRLVKLEKATMQTIKYLKDHPFDVDVDD